MGFPQPLESLTAPETFDSSRQLADETSASGWNMADRYRSYSLATELTGLVGRSGVLLRDVPCRDFHDGRDAATIAPEIFRGVSSH